MRGEILKDCGTSRPFQPGFAINEAGDIRHHCVLVNLHARKVVNLHEGKMGGCSERQTGLAPTLAHP